MIVIKKNQSEWRYDLKIIQAIYWAYKFIWKTSFKNEPKK
jgi:hypothetical protein